MAAIKWLTTMCAANTNPGMSNKRCGRRQFMTRSGATCKDGHGGADAIEMTEAELSTWNAHYRDGEQEDDPDFEEVPGLSPAQARDLLRPDERALSDMRSRAACPEIGGPHNYQHENMNDDQSDLVCVDCGDRVVMSDDKEMPPLAPGDVKLGDVVKLISGGPRMTVCQIADKISNTKTKPQKQMVVGQIISCVWFAGSDETGWTGPFTGDFDLTLLEV